MASEENGLLEKIKIELMNDFENDDLFPLKASDIKLEDDCSKDDDFASFCDREIKIEIDEVSPVKSNISSSKSHINNTNGENELPFVEIKVELEDFLEPKDETSTSDEMNNDTSVLGQPVTASKEWTDTESIGNKMIAVRDLVSVQHANLSLDTNQEMELEQCTQNDEFNSGTLL